MKKVKYEKPIVQRLGYDSEVAVGTCVSGGGFKISCTTGNRAVGCNTGNSIGTCTNGTGPPPS
jgi:hypothetical protein